MIFKPAEQRFLELYDNHVEMVRSVLYHMTSEVQLDDLVQEVFVKVWQGLPYFQFKSSVKTWVYRVTINTAMDHLRKRKKNFQSELLVHTVHAMSADSQRADVTGSSESSQNHLWAVQKVLEEINEETRSLITLFYFEELKVKQIADVLQIPEGTVKSRLVTARELLKKKLIQKGVFSE